MTPAARTGRRTVGGFLAALALLAAALAAAPAPAWAQTVRLGVTATTMSEGGGTVTVTADLTVAVAAAVTVTVGVTPVSSSGARTEDFTLTGTKLTIAGGATASTGTVTITAVNNDIAAADKRVRVTGSATGGGGLADPAARQLTIVDNDGPSSLPGTTLQTTWRNGAPSANTWDITTTSLLAKTAAQPLAVTPNTSNSAVTDFWACADRTVRQLTQSYTTTGPNTNVCTRLTDNSVPTSITPSQAMIDNDGVVIVLVQEASGGQYLYIYAEWVPIVSLPKATLALSSSSIPENGGVATVTATLDKPAPAAATVTVAAAPGAGTDFTLSGTPELAFAAGATASTGAVTITAVDDNADAANAAVTVSGTASGDIRPPDATTLTLIDDEGTPMLALALKPSSISEARGVATVTATLSGASSAPVTLTVQAAPGLGAAVGDFTLSANTRLTIAAGQTASSGVVTITAVNNDMRARSKQVTVSASAAGGGGVAAPAGVTLTITDNDGTRPSGSGTSWRNSVPAAVTWDIRTTQLLGKTTAQPLAVTQNANNADEVSFWACATKQVSQSSAPNIPVPSASICTKLSTLSTPSSITLNQAMIDNDGVVIVMAAEEDDGSGTVYFYYYAEWVPIVPLPRATLALSPASISETGGVATVTATLNKAALSASTLTVTVVPGAGAVAGNFSQTGTTLTFAAGATASTGAVTVTGVGNTAYSPAKTVTVSAAASDDVHAPAATALTITNDDQLTATLALSATRIAENGSATVTARLNGPAPAPVTVTVASTAGARTEAGDFAQTGAELTIATGATASSGSVTIAGVDDATGERPRTVTVSGTAGGGGSGLSDPSDPANVTLTIVDNDPALIVEVTGTPTEAGGIATVSLWTTTPVTGGWRLAYVTLETGRDQCELVNFANGVVTSVRSNHQHPGNWFTNTWTEPHVARVRGKANQVDDDNQQCTLRLATASGGADRGYGAQSPVSNRGFITTRTLTNTDDDTAGLTLSATTLATAEGGADQSFTVVLDSQPTGDVTVTATSGDAGEGRVRSGATGNFGAAATLTFTTVNWNSAQTVTVRPQDDSLTDGSQDYAITVDASSVSGGGTVLDANYNDDAKVPNRTVTVTNADDETGLALSKTALATSEDGAVDSFAVKLATRPSAQVTVAVTGLDASEGSLNTSSLTFATGAWNTAQTVTVTGEDDAAVDGTASYTLTLTPTSSDSSYNGAGKAATVTVENADNDLAATLALSESSISENGGVATVTASLNLVAGAAVTVTVSATPGAGTDFTQTGTTLTIAAGSTASTGAVTLTPSDDDRHAPDRSVTVSGTASASITLAQPSNVTLTIDDDESLPVLTLALSESSISETGGVATVTATLDGKSAEALTVTVAAAAGTGAVAADFTLSTAKTLTFAAGATASAGTVTVTANGNDVDTANKSVTVSATVDGGHGVAAPSDLTLTLTDDDTAGVTFTPDTLTLDEGGSGKSFVITLDSQPTGQVWVGIPAASGLDTGTSGILTRGWTPAGWKTAHSVTVRAVQETGSDANDTDDETLYLRYTASGYGSANVPNESPEVAVTVTVIDDDKPVVTLALSASSISEQGGVSTVTATLDKVASEATTVTVSAAAGTGAADTDFDLSTANTLTIAAGSTASAGVVTVTASGNDLHSGDKEVTVSATVAGGDGASDPDDVTLTLTDDETLPTVTLALSESSISEQGGEATVTATLDGKSSEAVTVTVGAAAGTGAVSGDFDLSTAKTLTIAAGSTASAGVVTVTANGNDLHSGNKQVTVSGAVTGGNNVAAPADVTLTLTDDETLPTVTLALSESSISETGGVATVTATLDGKSSEAVTVTVDAAAGANAVMADFALSTARTLTIASGVTASTGTVTVTANGNTVDSLDKSVTVSATVTGGNNVAAPPSLTLTLTDDDTATVTLLLSDPVSGQSDTIKELATAPPSERMSTVTATLSIPASAAVTITVSATTGTNAAADDFTLSTANTLTIAAGVTASTGVVTVTAVDDRIDSIVDDTVAGKKVVVKGAPSGTLTLAAPADVELLIWEDDRAALVTDPAFPRCRRAPCPVWLSVAEGASETFTVKLNSEPTMNIAVAVKSSESDEGLVSSGVGGTAAASTRLTFTAANWETAQTVTLHGVVDNVVDGDDDYTLRLFPDTPDERTDAYHVIGGASVRPQTVETTDADTAGLTVSESALTVTEGGTEQTFTVKLTSKPSAAVTVTVTSGDGNEVQVARSAGDATERAFATSKELVFGADDWNGAQTLRVVAVEDDRDEPDGLSVELTLDTASGGDSHYNAVGDQTVDVTKNDNDATPTVTLALSETSVSETGGVATVTATLDGKSGEAVTVTVGAAPGTGAVAADFDLSTAKTLTIAAGVTASAGVVTVTANGNDVDSPNKSVTISGTVAGGHGLLSNPANVTLMLTDDDALPTVTLALSQNSISETGGVTTVTATLSGASSEAVVVTVDAAAGTGAAPADFTLSAAKTLTIAAGVTTSAGTVTVTANGNSVDSPDKQVTISGTVAGGNGVAVPMAVTLTLTDDDALPMVTLALSPTSISETNGVATVTATLSGASSEAVTVTVDAAAGSGAVAADFTQTGTKLTIAAGVTTSAGVVTVTANPNTVDSPDKSVTVSATVSGGNGVAAPSNATLTLTDDESLPTVTLALSPTSISETGGVSSVTATLSGASSEAVTVTVAAAAGTGAVAADFTQTGTKLTIAAGDTDSAGIVTVTANPNTVDSPDKSVTVSGMVTGGNNVAAPSNVTLTLTDDDVTPTATLMLSPASINESGAANVATVTATLSHGSSEAVTITVTLAPVTSTGAAASDYTLSATTTLTIAAGVTSTGTVTVTAVDNTADEPDIQVTVSGAAAGGRGVANPSNVTLTIRDDDGPPLVTLALSPSTIDEHDGSNPGQATVTASLNRASSAATTVTVAAAPGTGAVTGSYTLSTARTLTIAASATVSSGTVTVTAVDDDTDAPDRSVTVSGTAANSQGITDPSNRILTIRDDDVAPTVTLSVTPTSISENGDTATVSATLSHPSSAATTVTVTAQANVFTVQSGAAGRIVIAAGDTTAASDTVTITAVNNDVDAADNAVTVAGAMANDQGTGTVTGASLTITDDDTAGFAVSPATSTSSRLPTSEPNVAATFTVALDTRPTGNVVLDLASSDTSEGRPSPTSLTFTATTWATAQTVTLTGQNDDAADGNQNYTVTLTVNQTNTADSVYDALAAVTVYAVNADDEHGLAVGAVTGQATEAGGQATFTVALRTQPAQAVTVTVSSRDGDGNPDASEGRVSPATLTFPRGSWNVNQTVTVTGQNDNVDDGDVSWQVRLDPSSGDTNYNGLAHVHVPLTTTDDDAAPGVTLAVSPGAVSENGGTATVSATLSRPSGAATTVTVTAASGLYTVASGAGGAIVIPANATTSSDRATVTAVNDAVHQGSPGRQATVTATAANDRVAADSPTIPMAVTGASLTLNDDESPPGATLALSDASISENGGTSAVSATLTRASAVATTVTVTAASGFYTVGSDATIVIAAGDTTAASDTATITAVNNATDEPNRTATVTATLSNDRGAGGVTGVTLTLEDDDPAPTVTLSLASSSISEDGGTTAVRATLSNPSSQPTTVTVTAQANVFTVAPGAGATIIVAAGATASTDTARITAVDNDRNAADNVVTVAGTATNGHGVTAAATGASLTITDDDVPGFAVAPATVRSATSTPLRTTESGARATFTVALATEPAGDVVVDLASSDTAEGTVAPPSLTFTMSNWNQVQTVTLTGVDDAPANPADGNQGYMVTLTVNQGSTADGDYDALSAVTVHAVNADNEYGLNVSAVAGEATEEGGTATFTVALNTEPAAAVTVAVTSRDGSEGRVSPASLIFTPRNWSRAQRVTVTGVDDGVHDGDVDWQVRLNPASGGDPDYNGLPNEDVPMTTRDDDVPTVTLALAPASISEKGGVARVTAMLSRPSVVATMVTVLASPVPPAVAGDFTQTGTMLTIAAGRTASTGTVTVAAENNDVDAPDKQVRVTGTAENARAVTDGRTVAVDGAALTIEDDDEKGLAFVPAEFLAVAAGGSTTYTVALTSEPAGQVTVTVPRGGGVTPSPSSLTFTAADWRTAQAVTVTAAPDDADGYADAAVPLVHGAAGGGYAGVAGTVSVAVMGDTVVAVEPGAGNDYGIGNRRVTVQAEAGVPAGIEVDLAGLGAGQPLTVTLDPEVASETVERTANDGFGLGPEAARTVVDIAVSAAPSRGVRICLPVTAEVRRAAMDRPLLLLHYEGGSWTRVAGAEVSADGSTICAPEVVSFSPFAVGYEDTRPAFPAGQAVEDQTYTVDEPIAPVTLPLASGGDCAGGDCRGGRGLTYRLAPGPETLPPGLAFDEDGSGECATPRTLCGTPAEEFARRPYTWTATDVDGASQRAELSFTIEVIQAVALARARLKAINESILPELSRASWDSAMEAVARRLESPAGGGGSEEVSVGLSAALAGFVQAHEQALEESSVPWRELLIEESFAVALGGEGEGAGTGPGQSFTVWGAGDRRHLSRDAPSLEWSGDLFVFHLGADADFGSGLTGGLGVSWFESLIDYVDRGEDEPVEGVHRSRMASVQPYVGWSSGDGSRLWASVGYGSGEIEIVDKALLERYGRQRSDSALLAVAAGGAVRLVSVGATRVDLKGEGQATRFRVNENGDLIEGLAVETRRLRVSAEGSREYVLAGGGRLSPSAELGMRWDGGDGAKGTGVEVGGGLSWAGPGRLVLDVGGRWLVAHRSELEEWGLSGGARLEPRANGRGLSLSVAPKWGEGGSGVSRLWEEGMAGRGGLEERSGVGVGVKAEAGYGVGAFGGFGVATPYTRFEQAGEGERRYGFGWRLDRRPGEAFALDLEAWRRERGTIRPDHGLNLDLRLKW